MPLKTSDRMSMSSNALFTRRNPEWSLLAVFHGVLDDVVEQIGIVTPGTKQRVRRCVAYHVLRLASLLLDLAKKEACGFGHRVIDGRELAAMHRCLDRTFQIMWNMNRHAWISPSEFRRSPPGHSAQQFRE
jgi:hypothetical protein